MTPADRTARSRFFVIGAIRLAGAITIALAVAITFGRIDGIASEFGIGLLVLGVIAMIVLPQLLVARWKSPPPEE